MKTKRLAALLLTIILLMTGLASAAMAYDPYYIIPDSDTRKLTENELWQYTRETLRYIRNELLARHGYAFSMDKFYDYFNAKPWYVAGGYNTERKLSAREWDNITLVKKVEKEMDKQNTKNSGGIDIQSIIDYQNYVGGYGNRLNYGNARGNGSGKAIGTNSNNGYNNNYNNGYNNGYNNNYNNGYNNGYNNNYNNGYNNNASGAVRPVPAQPHFIYNEQFIIPDSNIRKLTEGELWAYTRETLRYIRNEILARHGYSFGSTNKFAQYFNPKLWYVSGGYEGASLSTLEWNNIDLIKEVERKMDALGTQNQGGLDITTIIFNQQNGTCPGSYYYW